MGGFSTLNVHLIQMSSTTNGIALVSFEGLLSGVGLDMEHRIVDGIGINWVAFPTLAPMGSSDPYKIREGKDLVRGYSLSRI